MVEVFLVQIDLHVVFQELQQLQMRVVAAYNMVRVLIRLRKAKSDPNRPFILLILTFFGDPNLLLNYFLGFLDIHGEIGAFRLHLAQNCHEILNVGVDKLADFFGLLIELLLDFAQVLLFV